MKVLKEKFTKKQKNLKSARLIVRNLSFKCNENTVRDHFSKFGEIVEIKLLRKGDKLVGCGFVQFENKLSAVKAISKLSGNDFMGRPIIVDWALPKNKFSEVTKPDEIKHEQIETSIKVETPDDDLSSTIVNDLPIKERYDIGTKPDEEAEIEFSVGDSDSDVESYTNESNEESDRDEIDEGHAKQKINNEEENENNFSKKLLTNKREKKQHFKYDPQDVSDGRTVFIKNIPFSVNDDELIKCAEKIGTVIYAVVCIDPLTEHSKGTGFVKYKEKTVVDALLSGSLTLNINGNKLEPHLALKKNQIKDMKEKKIPKDNRNLFLVREGVILAGSPAAEGLSEADMSKRLQLEQWKTQTLRNLNKFVSPTRLVIHNLPPFVDDKKLRQIFKEHSPKGSIIKEVRIMRNLKDINEHGVGRSKGFGFVSFIKHEHALEALRAINNNPRIFKESRRPIVGFCIESMIALKLKEKRKEKSKNLTNKASKNVTGVKEEVKVNVNKYKTAISQNENLPTFSGSVAKPGVKKMRSRKELSMQAQLHHKSAVENKISKKKFYFSKKFKIKMKGNRMMKK